MFHNDVGKIFIPGAVVPFVDVTSYVVKFFRSVRVTNVSPIVRADRMIVVIRCGDSRPLSPGSGVSQLRHQTVSLQAALLGQSAELNQNGIDAEQLDGLDTAAGRNAGADKYERDISRTFPESVFRVINFSPRYHP